MLLNRDKSEVNALPSFQYRNFCCNLAEYGSQVVARDKVQDNFAMHARDRRMPVRENNDEKVKIRNLDLLTTPIYLLRAAYRCAFKPLNFYEKARTFALAM